MANASAALPVRTRSGPSDGIEEIADDMADASAAFPPRVRSDPSPRTAAKIRHRFPRLQFSTSAHSNNARYSADHAEDPSESQSDKIPEKTPESPSVKILVGDVPKPRKRYAHWLVLLMTIALAASIFAWKYNEMTTNSRPKIWDSVFNASHYSPVATNSSWIVAANDSSLASIASPPVPNASENGVRSDCSDYYSCYSCTKWDECGWCKYQGRCTRGSSSGSYDGQCSVDRGQWSYVRLDCATPCSAGSYSSDGWVSAPPFISTRCLSVI
jgi:hypothetical protein